MAITRRKFHFQIIHRLVALFFLTLNLTNCASIPTRNESSEKVPSVKLVYARIFDEVCAERYTKKPLNHEVVSELEDRLPSWRKLWEDEGVKLLNETARLTGKPFKIHDIKVSLSLCWFPSISEPLIVNPSYSLKSYTKDLDSDSYLIALIEHEILHSYVDDILPPSTPLLDQYKNESKTLQNHLHLFALQQATFEKLGWNDKLKDLIQRDSSLPNPAYQKAWELVNQPAIYDDLIRELKTLSK